MESLIERMFPRPTGSVRRRIEFPLTNLRSERGEGRDEKRIRFPSIARDSNDGVQIDPSSLPIRPGVAFQCAVCDSLRAATIGLGLVLWDRW